MAIDTATKRCSVIGVGSPVPRLLAVPDGAIAAQDRQELAFLYWGIAATTPVVVVGSVCLTETVLTETRTFVVPFETRTMSAANEPRKFSIAAEPRTFQPTCCDC